MASRKKRAAPAADPKLLRDCVAGDVVMLCGGLTGTAIEQLGLDSSGWIEAEVSAPLAGGRLVNIAGAMRVADASTPIVMLRMYERRTVPLDEAAPDVADPLLRFRRDI